MTSDFSSKPYKTGKNRLDWSLEVCVWWGILCMHATIMNIETLCALGMNGNFSVISEWATVLQKPTLRRCLYLITASHSTDWQFRPQNCTLIHFVCQCLLVTIPLPCWNSITKATVFLKKNPIICGTRLQFQSIGPWPSWREVWRQARGHVWHLSSRWNPTSDP